MMQMLDATAVNVCLKVRPKVVFTLDSRESPFEKPKYTTLRVKWAFFLFFCFLSAVAPG